MKLHLGSGPHTKPGWINLDIVCHPGVIEHDLTKPLPIDDNSCDVVYTEHFIEHISAEDGLKLLKECYRVLKIGGWVRISTPDLTEVVRCYTANILDRWRVMGCVFESRCQMLNGALTMWGHKFSYNEEELTSHLNKAGFQRIRRTNHDSRFEIRPYCGDLIMEGTKL